MLPVVTPIQTPNRKNSGNFDFLVSTFLCSHVIFSDVYCFLQSNGSSLQMEDTGNVITLAIGGQPEVP